MLMTQMARWRPAVMPHCAGLSPQHAAVLLPAALMVTSSVMAGAAADTAPPSVMMNVYVPGVMMDSDTAVSARLMVRPVSLVMAFSAPSAGAVWPGFVQVTVMGSPLSVSNLVPTTVMSRPSVGISTPASTAEPASPVKEMLLVTMLPTDVTPLGSVIAGAAAGQAGEAAAEQVRG